MSRRPLRVLVALAVAVLPLAACATVPTAGPVRSGSDLRLPRPNPEPVPVIGQHPVPGASPQDIVSGFLQSSADFRDDHAVAREYLTAKTRQRWRPQAGTLIYSAVTPDLVAASSSDGAVKVEISEVGRINADGTYRRSPVAANNSSLDFKMEKVGGEWRINTLADGLVLSQRDVLDTYQQVSLYFLAPSGHTLAPDTVLIPELPGLTTKLMARLLRGPTRASRESVGTAFPAGTALEVSSVPVRDGVATVRLDSAALAADDQARQQMSAQIVWTLTQLPDVQKVHVTAGGENLVVTGVPENQDRTSWPTYDPDYLLPASPSAYVIRAGAVGRYLNGKFEAVPGVAGTGKPVLRTPAVSLDASRLAAVGADGRTVYVGSATGTRGMEPRVSGVDLSQPSWDRGDNLWVVDRASGVLWYLANGANRPQAVGVPKFSGNRKVTGVAVARDSTQVALVVGTGHAARLLVGGVRRVETVADVEGGEVLSVVNLHTPLPDLRDVRDVAWADAVTLAVLGAPEATPSNPFYVDTDGYDVTGVEPLPGAVSITAAPPLQPQSNPLVAATEDGKLQQFTSGSGWQPIGLGSDPAYPG
jgi:hypothetical protein